jgi:tripartite-type tricarboxylate transporter receptor subunit TctC
MVHVPYKGGAAAMNDLLGGRIDMVFSSAATALPQMKAGRVRGLAVTTKKRSPLVPDLPTIAESGLPGYEAANWYGMVVPIKTPQPVIERLNAAVVKVLNDPETKSVLANQGLEASPSTSNELGAHMRSEASKWAKVIKAVGITPD